MECPQPGAPSPGHVGVISDRPVILVALKGKPTTAAVANIQGLIDVVRVNMVQAGRCEHPRLLAHRLSIILCYAKTNIESEFNDLMI